MRTTILATLCLLLLAGSSALAADADGDGIPDEIETQLGLLPQVKQQLVIIATSPEQKLTDEQAKAAAPDILSLEGCHVGDKRILLKLTFARPVDFTGCAFIIYADLDADPKTGRVDKYHGGTDTMVSFGGQALNLTYFPGHDQGNTGARMARDGTVLYVAIDAPFRQAKDGVLPVGLHLLSQREGGRGDSTPHVVAQLPLSTASVPKLALSKGGTARSPAEFRYYGDKVVYEKLSDKGLREAQVTPANPIRFGRPRPQVQYFTRGRQPGKPGSVDLRRVPVDLKEEAGVARQAAVLSFGFPLPQGALFNLDKIRLMDGNTDVRAQFTATAFWPDDSLKWVLIDATVPLRAGEGRELAVEFGNNVRPEPGPLWETLAPIPVTVSLTGEDGTVYSVTLPNRQDYVSTEKGCGKQVITWRGPYRAADGATYMQYLARMTQRLGTPRIELALTTLNDYVKTEFTDFTSLSVGLRRPADRVSTYLQGPAGGLIAGPANGLTQLDEATLSSGPGKGAGVVTWTAGGVPGVRGGAVIHDFWQRWPKGISATGDQIVFDLLPRQPSADYGKDLPYWLMFPFCEGKYRLKWGMAFTEKVSLDWFGSMKPDELWAEAQMPIVPVLPSAWYAETKALGPLAAQQGKQFAVWDKYVADSFANYMAIKQREREYGFLNYGDWFGERGRNWGNNEYDLAHGLFMHFARTGSREAFRWATRAAQHRADVDTIWAYPDPYYVGGNHLHSIGHTGMWTETTERATWTYRYEFHSSAGSGHVWTDGIMDDWYLTGNPRAMEAALAFGEHVVWAFAPNFKQLGTHERSAGWSLRAIMALYQGTYDPLYLEAAKKIAAVALGEQKFDQGGAWPHVLPKDHAGDTPGAVGNNLFLIGVLLGGLQAYHEVSQDPAVLRSLTAGAEWVAKCFDEKVGGWPYSAKADGTPVYKASVGLNQLIICPLAYVGRVTGDERLLNIASEALAAATASSPGGNGKGMAQFIFFTSGTLAELQRWYAATLPDKGLSVLDGSPAAMAKLLVRTATSDRHNVRAPDTKIFYVRLKQDLAELTLLRTPHGAMNKRAEFATYRVLSGDGKVVAQDRCSTDDKHEFRAPLVGKGPVVFKVVIDDDQRGVWTLSGDKLQIVTQTSADFRIGGVGRSRFYFMVPAGTQQFSLKLVGVHTGPYGAVVLDPAAQVAGTFQGNNPGAALIPGAPPAPGGAVPGHPELGTLTVTPPAAHTGKIWSVILTAASDIGIELVGVPPYLALSPEDWFAPQ